MDKVIDAVVLALFVLFIFILAKGFVLQAAQRKKERDREKNARSSKD